MATSLQPVDLKLADDGALIIAFSDGEVRRYEVEQLYDHCPAADAKEERQAYEEMKDQLLPVANLSGLEPRKIVSMTPVGNYAYNIKFNRGSSAGIYRFELLKSLGKPLGSPR